MIAEIFLLINSLGTKTRQWVVVANGRAFPEVLINHGLARAIAWYISKATSMQADMALKDREKVWAKIQAKIIKEIAATIVVEKGKCPQGKMSLGGFDLGFEACLKCSHLRMGEYQARSWGKTVTPCGKWECGAVFQEVRIARKLADR
jgi:hypothetical protein